MDVEKSVKELHYTYWKGGGNILRVLLLCLLVNQIFDMSERRVPSSRKGKWCFLEVLKESIKKNYVENQFGKVKNIAKMNRFIIFVRQQDAAKSKTFTLQDLFLGWLGMPYLVIFLQTYFNYNNRVCQ